jgi:hypothetical protein
VIAMEHNPQDENTIQLSFAIQGIQIFNFSLDTSPKHQALGPDHRYTFEINAGALIDVSLKLIGIDFIVKVFTSVEKDDKVCELSLRMGYHIFNFDEIITFEDSSPIIPEFAMEHFIALTVSTTRGILFEKLQGSFLSQIILPLVDVTSLNKKNTDVPLIK